MADEEQFENEWDMDIVRNIFTFISIKKNIMNNVSYQMLF